MPLTHHGIASLGYKKRDSTETIEAAFTSVTVYSIVGFTAPPDTQVCVSGQVDGIAYRLAVVTAINAGTQLLVEDNWADNPQAWMREKNVNPPFLLVQLGPLPSANASGFYAQAGEDGRLLTYEAFLPVRRELRRQESIVLPAVTAGMTSAFSGFQQRLRLRKIDTATAGWMPDGRWVTDIGVEITLELDVSSPVTLEQLEGYAKSARDLANEFHKDVSRLFGLGLSETDPLKRFLFFFLAIERQVNRAFKAIPGRAFEAVGFGPQRLTYASRQFLTSQKDATKRPTLNERFFWCVLLQWTSLADADIEQFRRLKGLRDEIAHGDVSEPPSETVDQAERLVARIAHAAYSASS